MLAHLSSMLVSRYIHDAVGDFIFEYVDEGELDQQDLAVDDSRVLVTP
jgi:hypothetical protein